MAIQHGMIFMNAVDTNVLIYSCDARDVEKQTRAMKLIEGLSDGVLLWQVACEFIAASRKLSSQGLTPAAAWDRLADFTELLAFAAPSPAAVPVARRLHLERGVSFWDSMLIAACLEAGVKTLYTEDLPASSIEGIRIVNPFV